MAEQNYDGFDVNFCLVHTELEDSKELKIRNL